VNVYRGKKIPLWRNPNFRLSLSLSTILLLHRILYRFFTRLRAHLLTPEARPFRQRNKRTSRTLTSSLAPAVGASLAGVMLAVYPSDQLRITIAIYALSRAAEFAYNHAEDEGWIWGRKGSGLERPWWWGSWMLFPFSCGQLLHAFVFDRDCFPKVRLRMGNGRRSWANEPRRMAISYFRTARSTFTSDRRITRLIFLGRARMRWWTNWATWPVSNIRMSPPFHFPCESELMAQTLHLPHPLSRPHHSSQRSRRCLPYNLSRTSLNNIPNLRHTSPL